MTDKKIIEFLSNLFLVKPLLLWIAIYFDSKA